MALFKKVRRTWRKWRAEQKREREYQQELSKKIREAEKKAYKKAAIEAAKERAVREAQERYRDRPVKSSFGSFGSGFSGWDIGKSFSSSILTSFSSAPTISFKAPSQKSYFEETKSAFGGFGNWFGGSQEPKKHKHRRKKAKSKQIIIKI